MTNEELKSWRGSLGFSQRAAAKALGVSLANYQQLERGANFATGKPTRIDLRTAYACAAIIAGLAPYGADNEKTTDKEC